MSGPQRLTGLDASFLYLETANQPVQLLTVLELDTSTIPGGYNFERFCEALRVRMRGIPAFQEKLSDARFDLDHPAWVADPDFDIHRHVHRIAVRNPGGPEELAEVCGPLVSVPVERSGPLWEMWVIEGADGPIDGHRLYVLLKMHHAAADGVTYAELLSELCSEEPDPPVPLLAELPTQGSELEMALSGLAGFVSRPKRFITTVLPGTVRALRDVVQRTKAGRAMAAPFSAPRTSLNRRFTARRTVAFTRVELEDVKRVKNHFGVTVNDVVMALASGVVRQFLVDRGELPARSLVALVPSSVHEQIEGDSRNQVSGMFTRLQTQIADPVQRLIAVAEANTIAKEQSAAIGATLLQDWFEIFGGAAMGIAKRVYGFVTRFRPMYNVIVSNVPGPRGLTYFMGASVTGLTPFGPVLLGAGLNMTITTANGRLHFGLISPPELVPDIEAMAAGIPASLNELLARID
ncbi:MAG TPA: wax ester/triacylglycerol synthase family O-acyltransferase [Mycobacterium sp.]|uniref:WS/DGAT/MGAT family O-acyltransferase n=1 Tax=Mycolicibacterium sp. TaxID=2320850 RepID=UPI0025EBE369|nr:wax ester/triacylglycerol synthase family O-acyltransferase [Mycolicibacterium sp.]HPX35847.1 wax ester/triacylglycerol synthase family O-acyltransferase [Mycobacterium sp.]HQC76049.1 wax ester/triacylglycerol synthase family O-acyltransferase [Mycobacterium sp.]